MREAGGLWGFSAVCQLCQCLTCFRCEGRGAHGKSRKGAPSLACPRSPASPHLGLSAGLLLSQQYQCSPASQSNTKCLITIWEVVHSPQYLPQGYLRATSCGERQRRLSCSGGAQVLTRPQPLGPGHSSQMGIKASKMRISNTHPAAANNQVPRRRLTLWG